MADAPRVCLLGEADGHARRPSRGHPLIAGGRAARGPGRIADRARRLLHHPHRALLAAQAAGGFAMLKTGCTLAHSCEQLPDFTALAKKATQSVDISLGPS